MLDKQYILDNVELLDSTQKHYEHETLIARPCQIHRLEVGERMIISFDVGSLRTLPVQDLIATDDKLIVTTFNNRYVFDSTSECAVAS